MFLVTAFEKGGINRKLCFRESKTCWSLHALWDAEMLKIIENDNLAETDSENNLKFDIERWVVRINKIICKIYEYPKHFKIEDYVEKFRKISIYLVKTASTNIAAVLNSNREEPLQLTENDQP